MTTELLEVTTTKKKLRIVVTEEDIATGSPLAAHACPVANAARRYLMQFPVAVAPYKRRPWSSEELFIYPNLSWFIWIKDFPRYELPDNVAEIIKNYDITGKMEPFTFDLNLDLNLE